MSMDADTVITLDRVAKRYSLESRPWRRLWQQLSGRADKGAAHHALQPLDLQVRRGESVGLIGRNGAGKSTLLQLVCGVLQPSQGTRAVHGRIAALLELGAGFNPELTGRENVRLNGPLLGLSSADVEARLPGIVEFAGIGDFIDQPVRSYSSGMFVRLAFSMATSVEPDILVIDEALSVGDGDFARRSFERIMALKERGATVLFCSHSMFQVEQLCTRALWLHDGRVMFDGLPHQAIVEYEAWQARQAPAAAPTATHETAAARIESVAIVGASGGASGGALRSGQDDLRITVRVRSDPAITCPTLGVVLCGEDGRMLASAGNWLEGVTLVRDAEGRIEAEVLFPALALLKGRYSVSVYVLCDRAINLYAAAERVAPFEVVQDDVRQGVVWLPHRWHVTPGARP